MLWHLCGRLGSFEGVFIIFIRLSVFFFFFFVILKKVLRPKFNLEKINRNFGVEKYNFEKSSKVNE